MLITKSLVSVREQLAILVFGDGRKKTLWRCGGEAKVQKYIFRKKLPVLYFDIYYKGMFIVRKNLREEMRSPP